MDEGKFLRIIQAVFSFTVMLLLFTILLGTSGIYLCKNPELLQTQKPALENATQTILSKEVFTDSIHNATGFIQGEHLDLVIANCTGCHSSKLIIQNRATQAGWIGMIKWMQQTQNLPDLGENEEKIVSYLTTHYGPEEQGRRKPLTNIEWYVLE